MRLLILCLSLVFLSTEVLSQSENLESEKNNPDNQEEFEKGKNKISLGWAYYGRGNGVSAIYDREFFEFFSQGIGIEEYFIEDEVETSFFLVTEIPIQKYLNINSGLEIYPGLEYGSFGGEFEAHPFLGFSYPFGNSVGLYTEIGSRGVFGLYYKF
jgi:hypothetical protein|tara:strand:+ start:323 stop:790 length:468 start_codon:yes stop_codon:yes gene_type:complete